MFVAGEVHSLQIALILEERRRQAFFQLAAALVDVIAAGLRNLSAFEPQPLTRILLHAQCFAHHTPSCVDMPESGNLNM